MTTPAVRHVHRCPTIGCGGSIHHTSDICRNPEQVMLCNRCYYAQNLDTSKADSEWDPWADERQ